MRHITFVWLALLSLFIVGFAADGQGNLPETLNYRGDPQRTGRYDFMPIRSAPQVKWQVNLGFTPDAPFLVGDTIYVPVQTERNQGSLFALDAETGEERWSVELAGAPIGSPAYSHERC